MGFFEYIGDKIDRAVNRSEGPLEYKKPPKKEKPRSLPTPAESLSKLLISLGLPNGKCTGIHVKVTAVDLPRLHVQYLLDDEQIGIMEAYLRNKEVDILEMKENDDDEIIQDGH